MFIINLTYITNMEAAEKAMQAHKDYLSGFYASGRFICAGRKKPRTGGVILCNAKDPDEVKAVVELDPFLHSKNSFFRNY